MTGAVTRGLASALVTAVLAAAPSASPATGCSARLGRSAPRPTVEPPPPPPTTATTPPIWAPPETSTAAPAPPAPASGDLAKAQKLVQAGEPKKVKALLEKKVRAGKASREEAMLLLGSCVELRDKACVDATRARYPDAAGE